MVLPSLITLAVCACAVNAAKWTRLVSDGVYSGGSIVGMSTERGSRTETLHLVGWPLFPTPRVPHR